MTGLPSLRPFCPTNLAVSWQRGQQFHACAFDQAELDQLRTGLAVGNQKDARPVLAFDQGDARDGDRVSLALENDAQPRKHAGLQLGVGIGDRQRDLESGGAGIHGR